MTGERDTGATNAPWWLCWLATSACVPMALLWPTKIADWTWIRAGGVALLGSSGLDVYADLPGVQVGPLGLLVGGLIGPQWAGQAATALLLAPVLHLALRDATRRQAIAGAALLVVSWSWLAVSGHVEDGMATLGVLAAWRAGTAGKATLWLTLAAACKPWAACAAPLLLTYGIGWAALFTAGQAAIWGLFLARSGAAEAMRVTFLAEPASLIGVLFRPEDPDRLVVLPGGYRIAQLLLVTAAVCVVMWRRRLELLLLVMVDARLFLDPGTWHYYYAPLAVGALIVDLHRRHRMPWLALVAAVLGLASNTDSQMLGAARLCVLAGLLVAAAWPVWFGDAEPVDDRALVGARAG